MKPNSSTVARLAVLAFLWLAFAYVQVNQSARMGQLALPITYDDNEYFLDGLTRLDVLYAQGVSALLSNLWEYPPHSVHSTLVPMVAFALGGVHDTAPAAANAFVVLPIFLLLLLFLARDLPLHTMVLLALAALTWPMWGHVVIESRPDLVWSLLVSVFALGVCTPGFFREKWRHYAGGALLGYVLICKPPMAPVALFIAGIALVARALLTDEMDRFSVVHELRKKLNAALRIGLAALLVSGLYYAANLVETYQYIYDNIFGDHKEVWSVDLSLADHLKYYLTGRGARYMQGSWMYAAPVIILAALLFALRRGDRSFFYRATPFAITFGAAYLVVSLPSVKTPFLGSVVGVMLFLAWLVACIYLVGGLAAQERLRLLASLFPALLVVYGVLTYAWPYAVKNNAKAVPFGVASAYRTAIDGILDALTAELDKTDREPVGLYLVGIDGYLNPGTLRYEVAKRRPGEITVRGNVLVAEPDVHLQNIDSSEYVLTLSDEIIAKRSILPLHDPATQKVLKEYIAESSAHCMVASYALADDERIDLYRSYVSAWSPISPVEGLGQREGPYPDRGLPEMRWGIGPASAFRIAGVAGGGQLVVEASSLFDDHTISFFFEGARIGEHTFASKNQFETLSVPIPEGLPSGLVTIRYEKYLQPDEGARRPLSVLYTKLQIRSATTKCIG